VSPMFGRGSVPSTPRVLLVSHASDFGGGGEIGFRDIMLAIREKRPDAHVAAVFPDRGTMSADAARNGVATRVGSIPWWAYLDDQVPILRAVSRPLKLAYSVAQAVWYLRRLRPTLVLTNTMVIPSYAVAARLLRIPHFWMVREFGRDDHGFRFVLGYEATVRLISHLSVLVICNSRAVDTALRAVAPDMKTSVIYPVIDPAACLPPVRRTGDPFRAVLVGRFAPSKGQHLAIEAVAAARRNGVEIQLNLVGSGDREPLVALSQSLGVDDLVRINGPSGNIQHYWADAHVGLMCSDCEAFGRVTVEAMSAGLPVCGTEAGGTTEIIHSGFNGLLSPAKDPNALARNLISLASDEDLRRSLAEGAIHTAQRFRRGRFNDELAAVLGLD
jgi:glycosyltransferase involved in cell wall biosynthesis